MPRQPTPQEQQSYENLVKLVLKEVYTEQMAASFKKMAVSSGPVEALVMGVTTVMKTLSVAGQTSNKNLGKYLPSIATELVANLADMLVKFKVIQPNDLQQILQSANSEVQSIIGGK